MAQVLRAMESNSINRAGDPLVEHITIGSSFIADAPTGSSKRKNMKRISSSILAPAKTMSRRVATMSSKVRRGKRQEPKMHPTPSKMAHSEPEKNDACFDSKPPPSDVDTDTLVAAVALTIVAGSPEETEAEDEYYNISPASSEDSPICPDFLRFLNDESASSSCRPAVVTCNSPLYVPHFEDGNENGCYVDNASMSRSCSNHSIPSLMGTEESASSSDDGIIPTQEPLLEAANNVDEAADSALVWGALGMILGSPAPKSVFVQEKKLKRTSSVNLWQSEGEDMDDMISLPQDDASCEQESQSLGHEGEISFNLLNESFKKTVVHRGIDETSMPGTSCESYSSSDVFSHKSLEGDSMHRSISAHSIPSICTVDSQVCDLSPSVEDITPSPISQEFTNTKNGADSALVWGALGMILGSPAPKSVLLEGKKQKKRMPVNLWQDDEAETNDLEHIMSLAQDDVSDTCSIPSVSSDDDSVPEIDCSENEVHLTAQVIQRPSNKDLADSTLAWTALTAILGSPAPMSAAKKRVAKGPLNLWEDGEESDLLPEIQVEEDELDIVSVPSIDLPESGDIDEGFDELFKDFFEEIDGHDNEDQIGDSVRALSTALELARSQVDEVNSIRSMVAVKKPMEERQINESYPRGASPPMNHEDNDKVDPKMEVLTVPAISEATQTSIIEAKDDADHKIDWGSLATLLGSPTCVPVGKIKQELHSDCLLSVSQMDTSYIDAHIIPHLLGADGDEEDDDDTLSMSSLSETSDNNHNPSRQRGEGLARSTKPESSKTSLTNTVLAWGMPVLLMASPKVINDVSCCGVQSLIDVWEEIASPVNGNRNET